MLSGPTVIEAGTWIPVSNHGKVAVTANGLGAGEIDGLGEGLAEGPSMAASGGSAQARRMFDSSSTWKTRPPVTTGASFPCTGSRVVHSSWPLSARKATRTDSFCWIYSVLPAREAGRHENPICGLCHTIWYSVP